MKARDLYRHCLITLQTIYPASEAESITRRLFEETAGLQRSDLVVHPNFIPDQQITDKVQQQLARLLQHEPLQYVLGTAWFCGLRLQVDRHTLIPRPETEELVQAVVKDHSPVASLSILDIGTGSGCIALALKHALPLATITAIDLSASALELAAINSASLHLPVKFTSLDILNGAQWKNLETYDVIVSNPPYIPNREALYMDQHVTAYEPATALFVPDTDPLLFYRNILAFATTHLHEHGYVYVEIHEDLGKETEALFAKRYEEVQLLEDLFGKDRFIKAGKPRRD